MDLIRKMVLAVEDHPSGWAPKLEFEGYTPGQVGYHAYLLVDAGLAAGLDATDMDSDGPFYEVQNLTAAGHDFAEAARNQFVWDEVREEMRRKGVVSATLDVLKKLLDKQLRKHLELN